MKFGFTGNILRVDLSNEKIWIENPDEKFYRTFVGGRSLALYYMLKEMKPGTEAFSAENLLIFATSPLVGQRVPAINRYTVCAKSPLTGGQGEAEAAGYWGPELKKAGFDAVIIKGIATKPVYVWINNGQVEIRKALHIWGKDTGEAESIIREELKDKNVRIALIGKGGENLVRYANIINNLHHANGRCGLGAVMGSKRLKAIAVRGNKEIYVFNTEKIKEITKRYIEKVKNNPLTQNLHANGTTAYISGANQEGWLPARNWTEAGFDTDNRYDSKTFAEVFFKKSHTCFACPIGCKRIVEYKDREIEIDPVYGGPEYETAVAFGSNCGISDLRYVCKAHELCNRYSLDTISTGGTIAFAMHCYEKGLINKEDTDGLELKFGNGKEMILLLEKIANREGFGDLLAEGSYRVAKKIGKGTENYFVLVKSKRFPTMPTSENGVGLQYAFALWADL